MFLYLFIYSLQIDKEDEAYTNHEQNIEQLKRR